MAVDLNLTNVTSGYNLDVINNNFAKIAEAFEAVLGRHGVSPNYMNADLDMNNNDVINANGIYTRNFYLNGTAITSSSVALDEYYNSRLVFDNLAALTASDIEDGVSHVLVKVPGGWGTMSYYEVETTPDHSAYTTSNSGAKIWELREKWVTFRMFNVQPGETVDSALDTAVEYCMYKQAGIFVDGMYNLTTLKTYDTDLRIHGLGRQKTKDASNPGGTYYVSGFYLSDGAGIKQTGYDGASGDDNVTSRFDLRNFAFVDDGTGGTPADRQSWDKVPMFEVGRCSKSVLKHMDFYGANRREKGFWIGSTQTAWQCTIYDVEAGYCMVGGILGSTADSTDCDVSNNTFHHNKGVGFIQSNGNAVLIHNNSFENNEGPVGLYLHSDTDQIKAVTVMSNYFHNNADDVAYNDTLGSCGVQIGGECYGTDWTTPGTNDWISNTQPWQVNILYNNLADNGVRHNIRTFAARESVIMHNVTQSNDTTESGDIYIDPSTDITTWLGGNRNQGSNLRDLTTASSEDYFEALVKRHDTDALWQSLTEANIDKINMGDDAAYIQQDRFVMSTDDGGSDAIGESRVKVTTGTGHSGSTGTGWTEVFNVSSDMPQGDTGIALLLLTIEQTDGASSNQTQYAIIAHGPANDAFGSSATYPGKLVMLSDYPTLIAGAGTVASPWQGAFDNELIRLNGTSVEVERFNNWRCSIKLSSVDFTFSD